MAILQEYYDDNNTNYILYGVVQEGQTFTSTAGFTITSCKFLLYRIGNGAGNLQVKLYATNIVTHLPTGTALATSANVASNGITTNIAGEWVSFVFSSSYVCAAATEYALVLAPSAGDASHLIKCLADSTSPAYTGGARLYSTDSGVSFSYLIGADMAFRTYGTGTLSGSSAPVDKTYSRKLIAIGNGEIWYESSAGVMAEITDASNDIDTTDTLNACEAFQKIFIVNGSRKKVLDFVNTKIVTNDIGVHPPYYGVVLTGGSSGASMIVDYITAITDDATCIIYGKRTTTATFTSGETVTGTNGSSRPSPYYSSGSGAISFVINAAEDAPPHWYDWTVYGADATNFGAMPTLAFQVCKYRGRLNLCGDPNYPHQWYQSRQNNPWDFLYAPGDAQSPVAGNNADASEVGDIVKVAIPYHDDYLIFGCANELWYLSGDAAFGGELNILDEHAGILGDRAFCWDNNKNLYIMSTAGLLRIPVGFQSIENLTKDLWPDFITDLAFNASTHRITLAFSPEDYGIYIFKTTLADGTCFGWWYDLRTEGLFPDVIPITMGIYSAVYYQTENPSYRKLLVGCADGYIKAFDQATKSDDGTLIDSYVGFAPLALSTHPRKDGKIKNIDLVSGGGTVETGTTYQSDSNNVTCKVYVGRTAENILEQLSAGSTPRFTKTFIAPGFQRGNIDRREVRGQWGGIVLSNNTLDESWSMERLIVDSKEIGRSL